METIQQSQDSRKKNGLFGLVGAGAAAVLASICCLGPLVLLALGVSGAWIGNLTVLEPYRPIFVAITLCFLVFAFYRVYHKPKGISCDCDDRGATGTKRKKIILWSVTALIAALFIFPYLTPYVFGADLPKANVRYERAILEVRNMVCASCPVVVKKSLTRLDGVKEVKVTLKPPEAVVVYDPTKVSVKTLTEATTNAGYPSTLKRKCVIQGNSMSGRSGTR